MGLKATTILGGIAVMHTSCQGLLLCVTWRLAVNLQLLEAHVDRWSADLWEWESRTGSLKKGRPEGVEGKDFMKMNCQDIPWKSLATIFL